MAIGGALKEFFVSLGLDHEAAEWAEATEVVEGLNELLEKLVETVEEVAEMLVESVVETGEYAHALEALSARTGKTTETLQEYSYVSKLAGADSEALTHAWTHMARSLGEVKDGSAEASKAFAQLGVKVRDNHGQLRDQQEIFDDLTGALSKMKPGWERNAAAMKVFGRGGTEVLSVIAKGPEWIKAMREEAHELGTVMSEEDVEKAGEFAKGLERLHLVGESLRRDLAGPLIEALTPLLESLTEWVKENREVIKSKIVSFATSLGHVVEKVAKGIGTLVKVGGFLIENWKLILSIGAGLLAGYEAMTFALSSLIAEYAAAGISAVIAGLEAAAAWAAAAAPVLLLGLLITALVLSFEDVYTFLQGGESLIGRIGPAWTKFLNDFSKPHDGDNWFQDMLRGFLRFFMDIDQGWDNLVKDWKHLIDDFVGYIGKKWDDLPLPLKIAMQANPVGISNAVAGQARDVSSFFSGGASSPGAAAVMAQGAGAVVHAQQTVEIKLQAQPGQSTKEIADHLDERIREHHDGLMREAAAQIQGG